MIEFHYTKWYETTYNPIYTKHKDAIRSYCPKKKDRRNKKKVRNKNRIEDKTRWKKEKKTERRKARKKEEKKERKIL